MTSRILHAKTTQYHMHWRLSHSSKSWLYKWPLVSTNVWYDALTSVCYSLVGMWSLPKFMHAYLFDTEVAMIKPYFFCFTKAMLKKSCGCDHFFTTLRAVFTFCSLPMTLCSSAIIWDASTRNLLLYFRQFSI